MSNHAFQTSVLKPQVCGRKKNRVLGEKIPFGRPSLTAKLRDKPKNVTNEPEMGLEGIGAEIMMAIDVMVKTDSDFWLDNMCARIATANVNKKLPELSEEGILTNARGRRRR